MGYDDFIDISIDLTVEDLDKLDRIAAQADKKIQKIQKKGGIYAQHTGDALPSGPFSSSQAPVQTNGVDSGLTAQDKKFEARIKRISQKIERDLLKKFGKKDKSGSFISKLLGDDPVNAGKTIYGFGKNPVGFLTTIMRFVPLLGGVLSAVAVANFVIDEIAKMDRFFKVFIDRVDTRVDQLRSAQMQAEIGAGQRQLIVTSRAGVVNARESYNTYQVFNDNKLELKNQFKIRDTSGTE